MGARLTAAQSNFHQGGGLLHGVVYGFDMYDALVPILWAPVTVDNGQFKLVAYTGGSGTYELFVPAGSYNVTVVAPGYKASSAIVFVSSGSSSAINFYLYQSGVPVPEFPSGALSIILMVAFAGALLAKRAAARKAR